MRRPGWMVVALVVVALGAFGAGIWGTYRAMFPGGDLYRMTGVVEQLPGDGIVLVTHDAVSGLMGEMSSMALFAESKALLTEADLRRQGPIHPPPASRQARDHRRPEAPLGLGLRISEMGAGDRGPDKVTACPVRADAAAP